MRGNFMGRQLLRGVAAGLAALATMYAFGAVGLLFESLTSEPPFEGVIGCVGLFLSLVIGVAVLRTLWRSAEHARSD
jgi:hypothetical protein